MAGLPKGYSPVTWKNIDINPVPAFNALAQAGDVLFDQSKQMQEAEDARRLNRAISTMLSGGPRVSNDPRVDAQALQLAGGYDDKLKSDLLSAKQDQTGKYLDNITYADRFRQDTLANEADIKYKEEQVKNEQARIRISQSEADRLEAERKRQEEIRLGTDTLNKAFHSKRRELTNMYLNEARAASPGIGDEQLIPDVMARVEEDMSALVARNAFLDMTGITNADAYAASRPGQLTAAADRVREAAANARDERDIARDEQVQSAQKKYSNGDSTQIIYEKDENGNWSNSRWATGDEVKLTANNLVTTVQSVTADTNGKSFFDPSKLDKETKAQFDKSAGALSYSAARMLIDNIRSEPGGNRLNSEDFARAFNTKAIQLLQGQEAWAEDQINGRTPISVKEQLLGEQASRTFGTPGEPLNQGKIATTPSLDRTIERLKTLPGGKSITIVPHPDKFRSKEQTNAFTYKINSILDKLEMDDTGKKVLKPSERTRLEESLKKSLLDASAPYEYKSIYDR